MELRKELSILTSLELPATLIFDHPSVAEMTTALTAMLPALTAMLPAAAPASAAQQPKQAAPPAVMKNKGGLPPADTAASAEALHADWLPQVSVH